MKYSLPTLFTVITAVAISFWQVSQIARQSEIVMIRGFLLYYVAISGPAAVGPLVVFSRYRRTKGQLYFGEWLWIIAGLIWWPALAESVFDPTLSTFLFRAIPIWMGGILAVAAYVGSIVWKVHERHRPWSHWVGIAVGLCHAPSLAVYLFIYY